MLSKPGDEIGIYRRSVLEMADYLVVVHHEPHFAEARARRVVPLREHYFSPAPQPSSGWIPNCSGRCVSATIF